MTPRDRAALADALKDATPAILREDAALAVVRWQNAREDIARMGGTPSDNPLNRSDLRLAALALAASRVEADESVMWTLGYPNGPDEGDSFIAALAALLKGDR